MRETDFGFVHSVGSYYVKPRSMYAVLTRPWLVPAIAKLLENEPGPHVVHGFAGWFDTPLACARRLERRGVTVAPVVTVFTAQEHEVAAKLDSAVIQQGLRHRVFHQLELAWVRAVTNPVERRSCRSLPTLIVNYESVRAELERRYGPLAIRRLGYTPPTGFADPPTRAPLPKGAQIGDPAVPLIVSVSRHDGRKGVEVLIAALAGLRGAGIAFRACLVGPGLLLSDHRRLVRDMGLDAHVSLTGRVRDVMPYLVNADVYVLPSREEGSGSVSVLEAMQAEVAIVASAVDGIPEDLTSEHDALLVPPGEVEALQGAIARLILDPDLRRSLGIAARQTYEERFTPAVMARQLAELYSELGLPPPGCAGQPGTSGFLSARESVPR
jgi:glycosyltransferase involved in cell wall biosynthesis